MGVLTLRARPLRRRRQDRDHPAITASATISATITTNSAAPESDMWMQ
jgi:hypothetical protein